MILSYPLNFIMFYFLWIYFTPKSSYTICPSLPSVQFWTVTPSNRRLSFGKLPKWIDCIPQKCVCLWELHSTLVCLHTPLDALCEVVLCGVHHISPPPPLPDTPSDLKCCMWYEKKFKCLPSDWVVGGMSLSPSNDRQTLSEKLSSPQISGGRLMSWWLVFTPVLSPPASFLPVHMSSSCLYLGPSTLSLMVIV